LYSGCGKAAEASAYFAKASRFSTPDQLFWAWLAAQKLPGFDQKQWQARLETALAQASDASQTSSFPAWWLYIVGSLEKALGRHEKADAAFQKAFLLPDRMLAYHLIRLARDRATR
jgi:tetratricopeptide (TPR) repeat protein